MRGLGQSEARMRWRVLLVVRGRGGSEDFTPEARVGAWALPARGYRRALGRGMVGLLDGRFFLRGGVWNLWFEKLTVGCLFGC